MKSSRFARDIKFGPLTAKPWSCRFEGEIQARTAPTHAMQLTSIMTAVTAEQAEARLTLVLDYGNTAPAV